MSATSSLLRSLTLLGVIMFLANQIFPGSPQFPTITAPVFINPFDRTVTLASHNLIPSKQTFTNSSALSTTFVGCTDGWDCVQDLNGTDGALSYITLPNPNLDFKNAIQVHLTPGVTERTITVTYDIWCRYNGPTNISAYLIPTLWKWNGTAYVLIEGNVFFMTACGSGFFSQISAQINTCNNGTGNACGESDSSLFNNPFMLQIVSQALASSVNWTIDVSTARVRLATGVIQGSTTCGGDFFSNFTCQLYAIYDTAVRAIQYAINGLGWIFAWGSQIISILTTMINLFVYLYTIPGMPPVIQALVDIYATANIAVIVYAVAQLIRGAASG